MCRRSYEGNRVLKSVRLLDVGILEKKLGSPAGKILPLSLRTNLEKLTQDADFCWKG